MTVGFSFRVDIRPYSGYSDPGLPIASWIAQGGAAGDASGGFLFMEFHFQRDDDPLISEMFNLETMTVDTSASSQDLGTIQTLNMDNLSLNRPVTDQLKRFVAQSSPAAFATASMEIQASFDPWWLGAPNRVEGDSGLRVKWVNTLNRLFLVTLGGYVWGPRSVLADGGPRRPVGNLYGR